MERQLYNIKDTITGTFDAIFDATNDQEAIRMIKQILDYNKEHRIARYAKDLQLFKLGVFDTKTGEIMPEVKFIVSVIDLVNNDI